MDHLPLPDNVTEHIAVPYLRGVPYDNEGFRGYDIRQGWDVRKLRSGDIRAARKDWNEYSQIVLTQYDDYESITDSLLPQRLIGPFIQNWLFFGLFQTALNRPIEASEGIAQASGTASNAEPCLSSGKLFSEFVSKKAEIAKNQAWIASLCTCLNEAAYVLQDLDGLSEELGGFLVPGQTQLVLASLIQTIDEYLALWYKQPTMSAAINHARWLESELEKKGWCPNRLSKTRVEIGIGGLYYVSLLPTVEEDESHSKCTSEVCLAYNIEDETLYAQRHFPAFCRCSDPECQHREETCVCLKAMTSSNLAEAVSNIAIRKKIPLVKVNSKDDKVTLEVQELDTGVEFVAITHVWSDGMGNPLANHILACQAEYIGACVRGILGHSPLFWIDTLCVPRWPQKAREEALNRIDEAYKRASKVLVFSRELMMLNLPQTPDEILMRITQSKWLTRLWTMQEGVLAQELAFQFADRAMEFGHIQDLGQQALLNTTTVSHFPANQASLMVSHMLSFYGEEGGVNEQLRSLWFSMRHRATSRAEDEAICAAILLGLKLDAILTATVTESMLEFWKTLENIPLSILWVNGPRYNSNGARWAPRSLLDPRTWAIPIARSQTFARVCDQGLCFSAVDALFLPEIEIPATEDSWIEFSVSDGDAAYHIMLTQNVENPLWADLSSVWKNIALLWNTSSTQQFFEGVLVSITSSCETITEPPSPGTAAPIANTTIYARWLAQVTVLSKGSDWDQMMLNMPPRFSRSGSPIEQPVDISKHNAMPSVISRQHRWCLG